jgi:hypothetical protein
VFEQFTRHQILDPLDDGERKVADNFLGRLREIGVIEHDPEGGRGAYRFTNPLYDIYLTMAAWNDLRRRGV